MQTFNHDDCFNGFDLPYVTLIQPDEWRWYILERPLSAGAVCNFTATITLYSGLELQPILSSCTVKSK